MFKSPISPEVSLEGMENQLNETIIIHANNRRRAKRSFMNDLLLDEIILAKLGSIIHENWDLITGRAQSFHQLMNSSLKSILGFQKGPKNLPQLDYCILVEETLQSSHFCKRFENKVKESPSFIDPEMKFVAVKLVQKRNILVGLYVLHSFPFTLSKISKS